VWNQFKDSAESGKEAAYALQMMRTEKLLKRAIEQFADRVCQPEVVEETNIGILGQLSKWRHDMKNVIFASSGDENFTIGKILSLTVPMISYFCNQIALKIIAVFKYSVDCVIVCVKNNLKEIKFLKFVL
jgi:hypothetical protein